MKKVHSFDSTSGTYLGPVTLTDGDLSPLEDGVYLIPGDCVEQEPPPIGDGQFAMWDGETWQLKNKPIKVPEPDPEPLTKAQKVQIEIAALEATITVRRMREAVLGTDNGWLADLDKQITTLSKNLK